MKTLPKSEQIKIGTRESDGVNIIYVGKQNGTPMFFIVYEGDEVPEEIERGYTIEQILKFGQPDDWDLDWDEVDKMNYSPLLR